VEIYLLVRFAVMIIIVTVGKNTLIVSSVFRMLHEHDLISPLNGAGIVNSVFQRRMRRFIAIQSLEQGHTSREEGKMEPGPRPLPVEPQAPCTGLCWDVCLVNPLLSL
jgi:hypothetical protein